ncbi:Kelch repeat-containing protein [Engelhardtia mirabilis]|uniref:Kelch motif protein n=1 Tax=Engelhardtia mirabilis TaxID=2528011 RepID=A0A518BGK8_9BACT|nr:Kelch motif protein [Planctomycetes bacterium Pla133]QDV00427.1 Kelch motif protein [Planctomycetes bacterium Pla86]
MKLVQRLQNVLPTALLTVTAVLGSAAVSAAQCGCWEIQDSTDGSNLTGRHEAAYVEFGGQLYLMGGRGFRPVERFDPVTETWTNLGFPPLKMHHFQPVVWGDRIWVLGAFEGDFPNETPIPNIWIYDPVLNTWAQGPAMPVARNRGSSAAAVYHDQIYLVGGNTMGHNGGYVPWLDRYDPALNTWTVLPNAPHARDHFTTAVIGNKLIAAAGRQTTQPNPFVGTVGPADIFDLTAGTWSTAPEPIPTQRAGTMTVARGEHLIVVGGESTVEAHDEVEALDVGTLEWVDLPKLLIGRHSGGAVILGDTVYAASGAGAPGGNPELKSQEKFVVTGSLGTSASNLVTNGDLDAGLGGWTSNGTVALAAMGGIAAPSIEIQSGSASNLATAVARETYTLRGLFQRSGAGSAEARLEFLDAGSGLLGQASLPLAVAGDWTSFTLVGTSPLGTTQMRAVFSATGAATLRVDDVVLMDKPAELNLFGNPANPLALLGSTNGPAIGQTWDPRIDHTSFAPAGTIDILGVSAVLLNLPSIDGTIMVPPVGPAFFVQFPGVPFAVQIPNDPVLIGIKLFAQGATIDFINLPLTNALEVTIQS